jgi:hypothetical protein
MDDIIIPESPFYALSYKQHEYERDRRSFFPSETLCKTKKEGDRCLYQYFDILTLT